MVCLVHEIDTSIWWDSFIYFMQRTSWKNLFAYMGPGFLVSIAYIDPGNCKSRNFSLLRPAIKYTVTNCCYYYLFIFYFVDDFTVETDLQAGAQYKYGVCVIIIFQMHFSVRLLLMLDIFLSQISCFCNARHKNKLKTITTLFILFF